MEGEVESNFGTTYNGQSERGKGLSSLCKLDTPSILGVKDLIECMV